MRFLTQRHEDHLHYSAMEEANAPMGSGAVESLGKQLQRRLRGVRTVLGPAWIDQPAPRQRSSQNPRPSPPLELIPIANFGMHRCSPIAENHHRHGEGLS